MGDSVFFRGAFRIKISVSSSDEALETNDWELGL